MIKHLTSHETSIDKSYNNYGLNHINLLIKHVPFGQISNDNSGSGKSVSICAPQLELRSKDQNDVIHETVELGNCYILDSNLRVRDEADNCFKSPCQDKKFTTANGRAKHYSHLGYKMCTAGISIAWGSDQDEMILGLSSIICYIVISRHPPQRSVLMTPIKAYREHCHMQETWSQ